MQSKSMSSEVPSCFIQSTLEKYVKTMTNPSPSLDPLLEQEILEFCEDFIVKTVENYDGKTKLPNLKSCYEFNRGQGGNRAAIKSLLRRARPYRRFDQRFEPTVISLFGPPGSGKSTLVKKITDKITKAFAVSEQSVYFRNAAVKHWDGYNGQLITVIDDFGFDTTHTNLGVEVQELITLVSECDYVLPMASLNDKGMKFSSSFIILTSNVMHSFIPGNSNKILSEPMALMRRFGVSCEVKNKKIFPLTLVETEYNYSTTDELHCPAKEQRLFRVSKNPTTTDYIVNRALVSYSTMRDVVHQQIENSPFSLEFPKELPVNRVKVVAVPESLKVRVITRPQSSAYALKPLQLAMFKSLKSYKCFEPCHFPDVDLNDLLSLRNDSEFFLSGDYTSATDDMNINLFKSICKRIGEHLPGLKELIEWESDSHIIEFPKSSKLQPIKQQTGQLMGSLLSFPILCMVNAFTICKATNTSLNNVRAFFHGDDVAAVLTEPQYSLWKDTAHTVGLTLSQGKNYLSKDFVSIDSQIWTSVDQKLNKEVTGKYSLIFNATDISSIVEAQKIGFSLDYIRKNMKKQLKMTKRSLDVHMDVGGLGVESRREILTPFEHAFHTLAMRQRMKTKRMSGGLVRLPRLLGKLQGWTEVEDFDYNQSAEPHENIGLERKAMKIAYRFQPVHESELLNLGDFIQGTFRPKTMFLSW